MDLNPALIWFFQESSLFSSLAKTTEDTVEKPQATDRRLSIITIKNIVSAALRLILNLDIMKLLSEKSSIVKKAAIHEGIITFLLNAFLEPNHDKLNNLNICLIRSLIKNQTSKIGLGASFKRIVRGYQSNKHNDIESAKTKVLCTLFKQPLSSKKILAGIFRKNGDIVELFESK